MSSLPALSPELSARIDSHLHQSYARIFTPEAIEAHLREYVGGNEAACFWENMQSILRGSERILDVGSGYGAFVLTARQAGYDAYGLELATFDNDCARERLKVQDPQADVASIFTQGSALSLPFADESFDVVTFWNVIEHIPDYKLALKEAIRVLKPEGWIVIEAPNYLSIRQEAHYHVPWLPWLPKPVASFYLRLLGRDPSFLWNSIYYCSLWGVLHCLRRNGCVPTSFMHEKLLCPENIGRPILRRAVEMIVKCRLDSVLRLLISVRMFFPMRGAIQCLGRRK